LELTKAVLGCAAVVRIELLDVMSFSVLADFAEPTVAAA
jgi:hypothetical protein